VTPAELVAGIEPGDPVEAADIRTALAWLASTVDVYRRVRPATPAPHLVSYAVPVDPGGRVLLGDHVTSGLWLPPGGHVEPGEDPVRTAEREAHEELGVDVLAEGPVFLSVTRTVGPGTHTDVSLWFVLRLSADTPVTVDAREFRSVRWCDSPPGAADPAFARFAAKIRPVRGCRGPRS
jgi:8-oxo-dGTP diphosphatase